jgi:hypothetical protein
MHAASAHALTPAHARACCAAVGGVYCSERLNALAGAHWQAFSTQDYFDKHGVFAAVLWCAPLVLLLTAMLVGFLVRAARLLVRAAPCRALQALKNAVLTTNVH